jgi:hypothetical protein
VWQRYVSLHKCAQASSIAGHLCICRDASGVWRLASQAQGTPSQHPTSRLPMSVGKVASTVACVFNVLCRE